MEVDDGLADPEPSGVDGEVVVVAGPDDGAGEAVRPRVPEKVDDAVRREAGDDLAVLAGPPRGVREHREHDAAAEVLRCQPQRQEPVAEDVEEVVGGCTRPPS